MRFSSYATIVSSASLAFAVPAKRQASSTAAGGSTSTVSAVPGPVTPSPVPAPAGGIGFNSTPTYKPMSDFDFQSLNLGLHQELIELDLFHYGLARFSSQDFEDAGLTPSDQYLIEFMADQEVGHATIFENFLARQFFTHLMGSPEFLLMTVHVPQHYSEPHSAMHVLLP